VTIITVAVRCVVTVRRPIALVVVTRNIVAKSCVARTIIVIGARIDIAIPAVKAAGSSPLAPVPAIPITITAVRAGPSVSVIRRRRSGRAKGRDDGHSHPDNRLSQHERGLRSTREMGRGPATFRPAASFPYAIGGILSRVKAPGWINVSDMVTPLARLAT